MERKRIVLACLLALLLVSVVAADIPPSNPFKTTTYADVAMTSATATSNNAATLIGRITGADTQGWFVVGLASGEYSYYTNLITKNGTGYFTYNLTGIPLIPGRTYYVRACTSNGRSAAESNFLLAAVDPIPEFTYGVYWDEIAESNKSPEVILGIIPKPIVAAFSGYEGTTTTTDYGWRLFYLLAVGLMFISFWLRQNKLPVVYMLMMLMVPILIAGTTILVVPKEFMGYAFGFGALVVLGMLYYLSKRDS
jgi:hypothetical protein